MRSDIDEGVEWCRGCDSPIPFGMTAKDGICPICGNRLMPARLFRRRKPKTSKCKIID